MVKRSPRQKQAAERARQRQRGRGQQGRREQPVGRGVDPVEYQRWVGAVMDVARLEIGVSDDAWAEIQQACAGNHRFSYAAWRPGPEQAAVFARTAVLEEYSKWLACEQAVILNDDGSVSVNTDVVAALVALPADTFEESWAQSGQPASAMFRRCCEHIEQHYENPDGWLADLHAFGCRTFGDCGSLAVAATIEGMFDMYDLSDVEDELARSGVLAAVEGAADRFDMAYRSSEAPRPTAADLTDLLTAVAAVNVWLDSRSCISA
jgi:hypothetical protein